MRRGGGGTFQVFDVLTKEAMSTSLGRACKPPTRESGAAAAGRRQCRGNGVTAGISDLRRLHVGTRGLKPHSRTRTKYTSSFASTQHRFSIRRSGWENSSSKFVHAHSGILGPEIDDLWIETVGGRILDFPKSKSKLDAAVR